MKILAFNASPRKENGATDALLNYFLGAAAEAGAEVEKHYIVDLNIKGCLGCFNCWWKTPGRCMQKDDMTWITQEIEKADALVLGTPIYKFNISHLLQKLRERVLFLNMPEMGLENGRTYHPARISGDKNQKIILAAVCGFPDLQSFNALPIMFPGSINIFLPAAWILQSGMKEYYLEDFIGNLKKAGKELGVNNDIKTETRDHLIVDYPPGVKKRIIEWYNDLSSDRLA